MLKALEIVGSSLPINKDNIKIDKQEGSQWDSSNTKVAKEGLNKIKELLENKENTTIDEDNQDNYATEGVIFSKESNSLIVQQVSSNYVDNKLCEYINLENKQLGQYDEIKCNSRIQPSKNYLANKDAVAEMIVDYLKESQDSSASCWSWFKMDDAYDLDENHKFFTTEYLNKSSHDYRDYSNIHSKEYAGRKDTIYYGNELAKKKLSEYVEDRTIGQVRLDQLLNKIKFDITEGSKAVISINSIALKDLDQTTKAVNKLEQGLIDTLELTNTDDARLLEVGTVNKDYCRLYGIVINDNDSLLDDDISIFESRDHELCSDIIL